MQDKQPPGASPDYSLIQPASFTFFPDLTGI
jgi:hypothetical protein